MTLYSFCFTDTAILVHSGDTDHGFPGNSLPPDDICLDFDDSSLALAGLRFGGGIGQSLDSPSDCTTLSTVSTITASALDPKHRYHMFFAYCQADRAWVEQAVNKLESDIYGYRCCYADRDFDLKVRHVCFIDF